MAELHADGVRIRQACYALGVSPSGYYDWKTRAPSARPVSHAWLTTATVGRRGCWSSPGRRWLASLELPAVSREVIDDALVLMDVLQQPIDRLDEEVRQRAKADPRVKVLTQLPGVGMFTALVLLAEIGDISRFSSARKLASWVGLTPTVRGSDRTVHHGHISKQGLTWVRWVTCEAAQTAKRHPDFAPPMRRSPAAAARRSPLPRSPAGSSPAPITCSPTPASPVRPANGRVASSGRARKFA